MKSAEFVHLNIHSEYSLKDSIVRLPDLIQTAVAHNMPAVAVNDAGNMFGAIKLYSQAMAKGVKPIISAEVNLMDEGVEARLILLCKDHQGYLNLSKLISKSFSAPRSANKGVPSVKIEWLREYSESIIALSGAKEGHIGKCLLSDDEQNANIYADKFKQIYPGRFFVELQRIGHPDDDRYISRATELAARKGIPVVATNSVRFLRQEEYETHEVRVAIAQGRVVGGHGKTVGGQYTRHQYLKTPAEMASLFADIPSAIHNTVEIAKQCSLELQFGMDALPNFSVPDGMTEKTFLRSLAESGLTYRLKDIAAKKGKSEGELAPLYRDRLAYELNVIQGMGFDGYFLIVADFIRWAKEQGIPVGPGRGSGAGSLVAYSLGITDLDPLEYDLFFERFLNPERVSMPDFDIDFCMDRRDEVIQYVSDKYGRNAVSQIITFGTMAARSVVRDVTRSLGLPYMFGSRIANLIPGDPGVKLKTAIETDPALKQLYDTDEDVRKVLDHSLRLEGITRHVGKHAGGVLISPTDLTDFTPTYAEHDGSGLVSQYDKDDVEKAGLVKFDFLGLRTLTVIQRAVDNINAQRSKRGEDLLDMSRLSLDDKAALDLISRSETTAVFQLESPGMMSLVGRLKPDNIEELIALVALFRPGPLQAGMVDEFVNRKNGVSAVEYAHPWLEPILKNTYGVFVYQEQVMQTARDLAGYTLGQADVLRKAMGKKKPEEMAKQREKFVNGAVDKGLKAGVAEGIFDLMEKFAGYGFNKSHSAAYSYLTYQTAWLKAHYPAEFMAAVLSSDMGNTDKIVTLVHECRKMGVVVQSPDVNLSSEKFTVSDNGEILFGLGAIKCFGDAVVCKILDERKEAGSFASLDDLLERCRLNKRAIESGIKAGAFDSLGASRASMYAEIDRILVGAKTQASSRQGSMFDEPVLINNTRASTNLDWGFLGQLKGERESLGLYLTGHPLDLYRRELDGIITAKLCAIVKNNEDALSGQSESNWRSVPVTVAGLVVDKIVSTNKKGLLAKLKIDDGTGQLEVILDNKEYTECADAIKDDSVLIVEGYLRYNKRAGRLQVKGTSAKSLDEIRCTRQSQVLIRASAAEMGSAKTKELVRYLEQLPEGPAEIMIQKADHPPESWVALDGLSVSINDAALTEIETISGSSCDIKYFEKGSGGKRSVIEINQASRAQAVKESAKKITSLLELARRAMEA